MSEEDWVSAEIALDRPNVARMYDYMLGGYHNFEMDRRASDAIEAGYPDMRPGAMAHRAMLRRVVTFLVAEGIDQFLDIGSGIPTVGNVHEVAQALHPGARVVYVDIDPVAVAHSKAILRDNPDAGALRGDVHHPDQILAHPEVKRLLDFGRPAAILLLAVLHFIADDEEAYSVVRTLRDALAPGSDIAISHFTFDNCPSEVAAQIQKIFAQTSVPTKYRTYARLEPFFAGLEPVEPGIVYTPLWRPDDPQGLFSEHPERSLGYVGVGRKP
jgi:hypothetical protein